MAEGCHVTNSVKKFPRCQLIELEQGQTCWEIYLIFPATNSDQTGSKCPLKNFSVVVYLDIDSKASHDK